MFRRAWCKLVTVLLWSVFVVAAAGQQVSNNAEVRFVGEVTGDNVYVRSGPSANYYPVTKLNAGAPVTVYGTADTWYAIAPPEACFSVIHKQFVDIGDSPADGVVNGNAVRVRAGSELRPDLYAKQLKLNRGAKVTVLGPHNDDYLRIVPPAGARLYISRDYVARAPNAGAGKRDKPVSASPAETTSKESDAPPAGAGGGQIDRSSDVVEEEPVSQHTLYRDEIAELDAVLETEMREPLLHRDYASLSARYRVLAEQDVDEYSRVYAKARIAQLKEASEGLDAVRELHDLGAKLKRERTAKLIERNQWRMRERKIGRGFDAIGELRPSMIWNSPTGPKRYRLVDQQGPAPRTIGYVEISPGSDLEVNQFLGRRVGVRASATRLETQDVDPIVIYVASELVVVDKD